MTRPTTALSVTKPWKLVKWAKSSFSSQCKRSPLLFQLKASWEKTKASNRIETKFKSFFLTKVSTNDNLKQSTFLTVTYGLN